MRFDGKPDNEQVEAFVRLLNPHPERIFELRVLEHHGRNATGFYTEVEPLVRDIVAYADAQMLCVGLNPRGRDVLKELEENKVHWGINGGTDADVIRIEWLFIDIDTIKAVRKQSATKGELQDALTAYEAVCAFLDANAVPYLRGLSGNGRHILVLVAPFNPKLDPNGLVNLKVFLQYIKVRFDSSYAEIDTSCVNPSRVIKCYGTFAKKGENSAERPWRLARIKIPDSLPPPIDHASLAAKIPLDQEPQGDPRGSDTTNSRSRRYVDIVGLCKKKGIYIRPTKDNAHAITCPWDHEHTTGTARDSSTVIFAATAERGPGFFCHHSHCQGRNNLQSFLSAFDPELIKEFTPDAHAAEDKSSSSWPEPTRLPSIDSPAPVMPLDLIPLQIQEWVCDAARRAGVPVEFIAVPFIASVAATIGRKYCIQPKKNDHEWKVFASVLWCILIARSGERKTPALAAALSFLYEIAKKLRADFEKAQKNNKTARQNLRIRLKAQKDKLKSLYKTKGNERDIAELQNEMGSTKKDLLKLTPKLARRIVEDTTVEKLGELLRDNPNGLGVFVDELTGWLNGLERKGHECARAFFLKAWNGNSSDAVDRIGRGTIIADALYLVLVGGIQPSVFQRYLRKIVKGEMNDDGLVQRFQLAIAKDSKTTYPFVDEPPKGAANREVFEIIKRIDNAKPNQHGTREDNANPKVLRFSKGAQPLFDAYARNLTQSLQENRNLSPVMESHIAKYLSTFPALAMVFYLLDRHSGLLDGDEILREHAELALKWMGFLFEHAKRIYGAVTNENLRSAHALLLKIREGAVKDRATVREIKRHGWADLSSSETLDAALEVLEDHHFIRVVEERQTGSGRPSKRILINPRAMSYQSMDENIPQHTEFSTIFDNVSSASTALDADVPSDEPYTAAARKHKHDSVSIDAEAH